MVDHSPYFQVVHDPHHMQVSDYWEHPFQYSIAGANVVLTSAGPNRRFGDEDDLTEVIPPLPASEAAPRAAGARIGRPGQ